MSTAPIKFTADEVDHNGFITVAQVAVKLSCSKSKIYKLIEQKLLRAYTADGSDRQMKRLMPADVTDYVRAHFKANFARVT